MQVYIHPYSVECSTDEIPVLLEALAIVAGGGADDCLFNET